MCLMVIRWMHAAKSLLTCCIPKVWNKLNNWNNDHGKCCRQWYPYGKGGRKDEINIKSLQVLFSHGYKVTVSPLFKLKGHPQGNGRWSLNRGWTACLKYFYHRINFEVNMESYKDNQDINMHLNVFITHHLLFHTLTCHPLFQNKVIKFWVAV